MIFWDVTSIMEIQLENEMENGNIEWLIEIWVARN